MSVEPLISDAAVEAAIASIKEQGAMCPRVETNPDLLIMGGWAVNVRKVLREAAKADMPVWKDQTVTIDVPKAKPGPKARAKK